MISPVIYCASNKVTGDEYIGATRNGLAVRKRQHLYAAESGKGKCRKFARAIQKYGPDAFEWAVIMECSSIDELMAEEVRAIAERKPAYNITRGGRGLVGVPRTAEWQQKIADANRGKKRSLELLARLRLTPRPMRRPVLCLNDGRVFDGIKLAAAFYKISAGQVKAVCDGKWFAAHGLHFLDPPERPLDERQRAALIDERIDAAESRKLFGAKSRRRAVVRLCDGAIFESVGHAARAHGINTSRVTQICNGDGATLSGLTFKYAEMPFPPMRKQAPEAQLRIAREKRQQALDRGQLKIKKAVICLDTGETFPSITVAARAKGVSISSVSAAIYRSGRSAGLRFEFARAA